jgi:hypothetical protein
MIPVASGSGHNVMTRHDSISDTSKDTDIAKAEQESEYTASVTESTVPNYTSSTNKEEPKIPGDAEELGL